jgi:hypothetical protein
MPSLLPRLGTLGAWPIKAIARGLTTAPSCLWGVSVRAVPVGSSRRLGWLRERDVVPGCRALGLLLKSNTEEPLCLV